MMRLAPLVLFAWACAAPQRASPAPSADPAGAVQRDTPPPTRAEQTVDVLFGQRVEDPYRWLESEKSPEVQAWMHAQDTYARRYLSKLPGRDALAARLSALSYVEVQAPPVQRGGRLFFLKRPKDREKSILYVREGAREWVLLDPNLWRGGTVSLGVFVPSWDGSEVAFAERPDAADTATLKVLDVGTGAVRDRDVIPGARYAEPSWTPDGKGFYYVRVPVDPSIPEADLPGYQEVRFHRLGSDPGSDPLVHARLGDPTRGVQGWISRDGKYLFYGVSHGWTEDTISLQRVGKEPGFTPFAGAPGARYDVDEWRDVLYIRTDEGAPRQRLFRAPAEHPGRKSWEEIVPEDPSATLTGFQIMGGKLVLHYERKAVSELTVVDLDGRNPHKVALPELGSVGALSGLPEQKVGYFSFQSFTVPREVLELSVASATASPTFTPQVPFDPSAYEVNQVLYPSRDGTEVPMFLVHRKDVGLAAGAPTLLYGYGGFDISETPTFQGHLFPWLDAGGVYAVANLRGGGELGKQWHEAGQLHRKQNVFDDFIAAGEYLLRSGVTRPGKLAITGASNGGLLVGAVMTQRPDLFAAVVCGVPLLDMVRYERFGGGPTWAPEYGTVQNEADFRTLFAYSPYHHVRAGVRYPALLMLSADHDDRVDPLHARKFIAAVQNASLGRGTAYLRIERNSGHGGADRVGQAVQVRADEYAFLFQALKAGLPAGAQRPGPGGGAGQPAR